MDFVRKLKLPGAAELLGLGLALAMVTIWSVPAAATGFGGHSDFDQGRSWNDRGDDDNDKHGMGRRSFRHRSMPHGDDDDHGDRWSHHRGLGGGYLTLADLVEGESFRSKNGDLEFSNFSAETFGLAPENLERYRVIPTQEGFKILSHLYALFGKSSRLEFDYDVASTASDLRIESAAVSFVGVAVGAGSKAGVRMDLGDVGSLAAGLQGRGSRHRFGHHRHGDDEGDEDHGSLRDKFLASDRILFAEAVSDLAVSEVITAVTEWKKCILGGGFSKAILAHHSFETTEVIPEPGTFALLAVGMVGLGVLGRRRV